MVYQKLKWGRPMGRRPHGGPIRVKRLWHLAHQGVERLRCWQVWVNKTDDWVGSTGDWIARNNSMKIPWQGCMKLRYPVLGQYQMYGTILCTSFILKLSFRPFDTRILTITHGYYVIRSHMGFMSSCNALAISQLTNHNSDEEVHSNI